MLLSRRPEKLKPDEQQQLAKLNECCPEIPVLYDLTQGFAAVFRGKQSDALENWLVEANRTGLPEISRFCDGLIRDAKAVIAAVILPWSNGQVEGQIRNSSPRRTGGVAPTLGIRGGRISVQEERRGRDQWAQERWVEHPGDQPVDWF